jgi:hypothetical protein
MLILRELGVCMELMNTRVPVRPKLAQDTGIWVWGSAGFPICLCDGNPVPDDGEADSVFCGNGVAGAA